MLEDFSTVCDMEVKLLVLQRHIKPHLCIKAAVCAPVAADACSAEAAA
jgi:hypothetical protein